MFVNQVFISLVESSSNPMNFAIGFKKEFGKGLEVCVDCRFLKWGIRVLRKFQSTQES